MMLAGAALTVAFNMGCAHHTIETTVSAEGDARALDSIEGTWVATSPLGDFQVTICQGDHIASIDQPSEPCRHVAHEVTRGWTGEAQVDLAPSDVPPDSFYGNTGTTVCAEVVAASLKATLKASTKVHCEPMEFLGGMLLAQQNTDNAYALPYMVQMSSDLIARDPDGKPTGTIGTLPFKATLDADGLLSAQYAPGLWCATYPCAPGQDPSKDDCIATGSQGPAYTTLMFHRITASSGSIKTACASP